MADEDERPRVEAVGLLEAHEGEQLVAVAGVVQARVGARDVEPDDLVDLVDEVPVAAGDLAPTSSGRPCRRGAVPASTG